MPIFIPNAARHHDIHFKPAGMGVGADQGLHPGRNRNPGPCDFEKQLQGLSNFLP